MTSLARRGAKTSGEKARGMGRTRQRFPENKKPRVYVECTCSTEYGRVYTNLINADVM